MTKDMLGTVVRKLVALPAATLGVVCDLLGKLTNEEWVAATKRFLRKENPWEDVRKTASSLLEFVGTAAVPAIPTFRAKEHFKDDRSGPVAIGYIGDNFRDAFLAGEGIVEDAVPEAALRIHELVKTSVDGPITAELGNSVAETTLGQMYEMMKAQGHGKKGNLLTNGYANIFYVRGQGNVLWTVDCNWLSSHQCWSVDADLVTYPKAWGAGAQIVSR